METLRKQTPTAHKIHKCDWCGGEINIGEKYDRSTCAFDGKLYEWKNHISCRKIASKLEMFDWCDDGVTEDDFRTGIQDEYMHIMSEHHTEEYEAVNFKHPPFLEQLQFVKRHHNIK